MVKSILAYLLIFCIAASNFSGTVVYTGYRANKAYITNMFCENTARPELKCEGKCYLMKSLKKAEKKQAERERETIKTGSDASLLVSTNIDFPMVLLAEINSFFPAVSVKEETPRIFHPPVV